MVTWRPASTAPASTSPSPDGFDGTVLVNARMLSTASNWARVGVPAPASKLVTAENFPLAIICVVGGVDPEKMMSRLGAACAANVVAVKTIKNTVLRIKATEPPNSSGHAAEPA